MKSQIDSLKTSSVVEIYKKDLEEMKEKENLTNKERKKTEQLISLVNIIGEIKVDEPKMLLKIWESFNP